VSVVHAVGERLPSRAGSLGGCRIERVLQHVDNPSTVLAEAVRCLRPGGLLTVFDPDWSSFQVVGPVGAQVVGWLNGARRPGLGGQLWRLFELAGCDVLDRVEELSVWRRFAVLDRVIGVQASIDRAVRVGRASRLEAERWLLEERDRDARGKFQSIIPKVLILARKIDSGTGSPP
jgi:SAM-dependent methyltransferase